MIDFEITFQADELRMKTTKRESDFRNHVQKIPTTI